jgi:hypothetical protein
MGARKNAHGEAYFFLHRNQRIFRISHAHWDQPEPVRFLVDYPGARSQMIESLRAEVRSFKIASYLGMAACLSSARLLRREYPWGWKDPRNTYTLPLWLEVFPDAKIVQIRRNGVDVANSLRVREQARPGQLASELFSCRCSTLEGAFGLWLEYERMAMQVTDCLPESQVFRLIYEDLVAAPELYIQQIARFLEIQFNPVDVRRAVRIVSSEGSHRFLQDDELKAFYMEKSKHPFMARWAQSACPEPPS